MSQYRVLILGAAYGLVPALRILSAGHEVTVVCRHEEQRSLARDGAKIIFSNRDPAKTRVITAKAMQVPAEHGVLGLASPDVDLAGYDLVLLAMSEPHFAAPEIAKLMARVAQAQLPVVSVMNMQPPPFLARVCEGVDIKKMAPAYAAWDVWQQFDPALMTAASPDAQAVRLDPNAPNTLTVTLGSNFKIAPFGKPEHQAMIAQIADDVSTYRPDGMPYTVRLMAHEMPHVPLAKWPMLIAGNCRCITPDGALIPIGEAVHHDLAESEAIYEQVLALVKMLCGSNEGFVPFRNYARAAKGLTRPSSFGRAVVTHGASVERVDKMVQLAGHAKGVSIPAVDAIVAHVESVRKAAA